MPTWNIGDCLHGFRVERKDILPHLNAHYWKLAHEKTGAALYYSDRDDGQMVFSVGFRTLPKDDTGVFHIIEHSVLDGSESFRLKQPFVNLMKTSLFVFLNAVTYPDKTFYYFSSSDERAFMNMMTVYLDAVFHPLALSDRRIFEKEAWHLEPDGEGGVRCSGVVFNEMQDSDSQPASRLYVQHNRQLFPDLYYRFISGGDPAAIRTLPYEQFRETYARFYRPDNAVFYLSGKIGFDEELSEIDRVLSGLQVPQGAPPAPAPLQAPVVSPDGAVYYQLSSNEPTEGNTQLKFSCVLGDGSRPEEALAFSVLGRYLAETPESPLSRAVLAAGIGLDFSMGVMGGYRQPVLSFDLSKSDPGNAERFREIILDTLRFLVRDGLNRERLQNLINDHEVVCRRQSLSVRVGFTIMESLLRSHVQLGDAAAPDGMVIRERLAENPRYFEELIEKYVLNSDHWALTRCIPSRTVAEEKRAVTDAWLASEAQRLHAIPGAYEALEAHIAALNEYLLAPDDPAAVAALPHLSPADIAIPPVCRDVEVGSIRTEGQSIPSIQYLDETGGISVAGLLFDLTTLNEDELFYARCLSDALADLPTERHSVEQLSDRGLELNALLPAGLWFGARGTAAADFNAYLYFLVNVPDEKMTDAAALVYEYLTEVVFDRAVLRHLFSNTAFLRENMIGGGSATALRLAEASLSEVGAFLKAWNGPEVLHRLTALANDFDGHADALIVGLRALCDKLFARQRPLSLFIGSAEAYAAWERSLAALRFGDAEPVRTVLPLADRRAKALTVPSEVNYCAQAYCLADLPAVTTVLVANYLNNTFFWDEIRAKGGAYGASVSATPYGVIGLTSFRDPHIADTYAVFDRLPDWLESHLPQTEEKDSLIVSTMSRYLYPQSKLEAGYAAVRRWLDGRTAADLQAEIREVLHTNTADFIAFADALRTLNRRGEAVRAVLGGDKPIRASGLFEDISEL